MHVISHKQDVSSPKQTKWCSSVESITAMHALKLTPYRMATA